MRRRGGGKRGLGCVLDHGRDWSTPMVRQVVTTKRMMAKASHQSEKRSTATPSKGQHDSLVSHTNANFALNTTQEAASNHNSHTRKTLRHAVAGKMR